MPSDRPRWFRRRIVIGLALVVGLLIAGGTVFALTRPGDVFNPDVEFSLEPEQTPIPDPSSGSKDRKGDPLDGFRWDQYGYSKDRRRYLPAKAGLRPPFERRWNWHGHVLLEFPPIVVGDRLFLVKNNAVVVALDRKTGKKVWSRRMGHLAASSPAYGDERVYVTILERSRGERAGRVAALRAKDGKVEWSRPLASRSESSPLYDDGRVYFGAENGTVYAMRAGDGSVSWRFNAGGAVKGGPALADGKLYFGAYGGRVFAVWQRDGRMAWRASTRGGKLGLTAGNFYSTPAVAFGRVYVGNTDGRMYSFSSRDGRLAWSRGTGSYVYASPAVAQVPGFKPAVYFGSYDGTFYALDARSGQTIWSRRDGGKISGAATVVGDLVYYSNWGRRDTTALGARTGRRVWNSTRGAFNPVVSDGREIYLTGFASVAAFEPRKG
jgi:outer membrane protein assembly factor BamB